MRMGGLKCGDESVYRYRRLLKLPVLSVGLALLGLGLMSPVLAKTPGQTHCYRDVCHKVKTIEQTRTLIGHSFSVKASHYDSPSIDPYNTGVYTSSGTRFDAGDPTAASSSNLPDGTELLVWNPNNGRAVHLRVTDFGPFMGDRTLDLTRAAATSLDFAHDGIATLQVTVVAAPPADEPHYLLDRVYRKVGGFLGVYRKEELSSLGSLLVSQAKRRRHYARDPGFSRSDGRQTVAAPPSSPIHTVTPVRLDHQTGSPNRPSLALQTLGESGAPSNPSPGHPRTDVALDASRGRYVQPTQATSRNETGMQAAQNPTTPKVAASKSPGRQRSERALFKEFKVARLESSIDKYPIKAVAHPNTSTPTPQTQPDEVAPNRLAKATRDSQPFYELPSSPGAVFLLLEHQSQGIGFLIAALIVTSTAFFAAYYSLYGGEVRTASIDPTPNRRTATPRHKLADVKIVAQPTGNKNQRHTAVGPQPGDGPYSKAQNASTPEATVIKPGSTIIGNLTTRGAVVVEGTITGDCICDTLSIGRDGVVSGSVAAKFAVIEGCVDGAVDVRDLHAKDKARVKGDVRYCNLSLDNGAVLEANCKRVDSL